MKNFFLYLACTLGLLTMVFISDLSAQQAIEEEIEVPLTDPSQPGLLKVHNHNGTVTVVGYDGQNVMVSMKAKVNETAADTEKTGLKRIPVNSFNVEISEEDNEVEVDGNQKHTDFNIKVPRNFSLYIDTHHDGDVSVTNVSGEMVIDCHHGGMILTDVSGSLVGDTHHGEIKANFLSVADRPMAFSTYHGDVDITLPASVGCEVKIKTEKGDIYTDFEMEMQPLKPIEKTSDSGRREIKIGGWMQGQIGSGGEEYRFNTYHGDIIIRKS